MTHFKTFILSCLLALAAFPATAEDADFTVDGFGFSITSNTSLTVEVVSGPDEAVVTVPSTVVFNNRTFRVTGIGNDAFQNHTDLQSVDMPSITYIDGYWDEKSFTSKGAFTGCSNLSEVNMPAATSIGEGAFSDCKTLTNVSLPVATSIGVGAFEYCNALTSISLPAATTIGDAAFFDCDALTSVSLPAATSIGYYAFKDCDALTSVSLPAATSIRVGAFYHCYALTSVSLPAATSIGYHVFCDCKALTSVSLPSATSIHHWPFGGCDALTSVSLPAATSIGSEAFSDCSSLCDIYVGEKPAQCGTDPFIEVTYATATLHVPAGCTSKYKAADPWKNFYFISEDYDPTGIKSTKANDVKIHSDNGSVQLTGLKEGEKVVFYSLDGKLIGSQKANSGTISITTSEPVVICKMGGKSIKILVK